MSDIFFNGHEMTHPFTSGLYKADMTLDEMRALSPEPTEQECQDPFFKYYFEEQAAIEPEHAAAMKAGPLAPEQCFMPEQAGRILLEHDPRYPVNGYGVLENGVGFASVLIHQKGRTDEKVKYYRENFAHTDNRLLYYKLWFPHMHLIHFEDAIIENWGWGMCLQDMDMENFLFSHIGIAREDILRIDQDCIGLLCIGGRCLEIYKPERPDWPMWMMQYTRLTPEGRELRAIYYDGLTFNGDGTISLEVNSDRAQTLREVRCMMMHCMQEYANEQRLMDLFWNDREQ